MADGYEDDVVRIALLAGDEGTVADTTFDRCDIKGPAILVMRGCELIGSAFEGDPDAIFWEVPPERQKVIGPVLVEGCRFNGCTFMNVGFAGPPEFIATMRAGTDVHD